MISGISAGHIAPELETRGVIHLQTTTVTALGTANAFDVDTAGPANSDRLINTAAGGGINLGGATLNLNTVSSAVGDVFTIVQSAAGGIAGTFAGLANNSFLSSNGHLFQAHYGTTAVTLTEVAAAPSKFVFVQQPTTVAAGAFMSPAVTVQIQDQAGNVFPTSAAVSLTVIGTTSFASCSVVTTVNAVSGVATFTNLKFTKAGIMNTLTASSGVRCRSRSLNFLWRDLPRHFGRSHTLWAGRQSCSSRAPSTPATCAWRSSIRSAIR